MRSRDTAVDLLAANYLGERSTALVDRVSRTREEGDVAAREVMRYERETRGPAVSVGALSRLPVGEAYALDRRRGPRPTHLPRAFLRPARVRAAGKCGRSERSANVRPELFREESTTISGWTVFSKL